VIFSNIYEIPADALEACRIFNIFSFNIEDLITSSFDWVELAFSNDEIGKAPWYILRGGAYIMYEKLGIFK